MYKIHKRPAHDIDDDEVDQKGGGLKDSVIQECLKYLSYVFNNNFSHKSPDPFRITDHIHIHGGCCRDSILGNTAKDIDISVDLHSLHKHASQCRNMACKLRANWRGKHEKYVSINKNRLQDVTNVLKTYLVSEDIINTGWLLKTLKKDKYFSKYCKSIHGPNERGLTLVTYQIYFNNGVDIDIMDCSSYIDPGGHYNVEFDEYMWHTKDFCWPITHKLHAKLADATFNSLFIPISKIIGVPFKEWGNHVIDPYIKYKMARFNITDLYNKTQEKFLVSAIKDLQAGVVRAYTSDELKQPHKDYSYKHPSHTGQTELIIFRTIKNVSKLLKHQVTGTKIIYIDAELQAQIHQNIDSFFDPKRLLRAKEHTNHGDALDKILWHLLNHNYFKKIHNNIIIAMYHLFGYDYKVFNYLHKDNQFKIKLQKFLHRKDLPKRSKILWKGIIHTAKASMDFYLKDPYFKPTEIKTKTCTFKISPFKFNTIPFDEMDTTGYFTAVEYTYSKRQALMDYNNDYETHTFSTWNETPGY
eukprot:271744_1